MDDAHLAEHCLHSLYSVEIDRYAHENLFKSQITELQARFSGYAVLADALTDHVPESFTSELLQVKPGGSEQQSARFTLHRARLARHAAS
jgi:hypothetical protein